MTARTIETARLVLRPLAPGDEPAYAAIRADPEVMRYLAGGEARAVQAAADAARIVAELASAWDEVGYGPWAAIERGSGVLLGHVGLRFLPEFGETEILYMLARAAWGRGLASEGALAARDFAFSDLKLARLIGIVLPENAGSIAVMRRIGMRPDGRMMAFGLDALRFTIDRSDPLAAAALR